MDDLTKSHDPTPEFYASAERQMLEAFRRESRFSGGEALRRGWAGRVVMAASIAVVLFRSGLVWGAKTGFASADLVDAREREVISGNVWATREFARGKLEQARVNAARIKRDFDKGGASRASLDAAELAVREMETVVSRIDEDLKRSRAGEGASRSPFAALAKSPVRSAIAALTCRAPAATT